MNLRVSPVTLKTLPLVNTIQNLERVWHPRLRLFVKFYGPGDGSAWLDWPDQRWLHSGTELRVQIPLYRLLNRIGALNENPEKVISSDWYRIYRIKGRVLYGFLRAYVDTGCFHR
jgi:hypothetical protein